MLALTNEPKGQLAGEPPRRLDHGAPPQANTERGARNTATPKRAGEQGSQGEEKKGGPKHEAPGHSLKKVQNASFPLRPSLCLLDVQLIINQERGLPRHMDPKHKLWENIGLRPEVPDSCHGIASTKPKPPQSKQPPTHTHAETRRAPLLRRALR
ncbi:hypothetical protein DSO57_1036115 [Entomophthora muscae]|uniref:Uncharacterized protein n=1 Tax=Entomophthora muscae TaxID=34485 RepID=A0ACC2TAC4_9FUNG|nr:hypothetical protein DSO57_1036115 [Entomophthora muscae]